jgi:hypothetical protein
LAAFGWGQKLARQTELQQCKLKIFRWSLGQQGLCTFLGSQCPEWDLPQRLVKTAKKKVCPEIGQFSE